MLLSKITLPGLFFTQTTDKLYLDKSTYDEHKLLKEINDNNECTITNALVDKSKINENLKSSPFVVHNITISKIHFYFNNNNLDSSITIENITIDLTKNNNIIKDDKKEKKENNLLNIGMLSESLINLVISVKNIKIRLLEEEHNNVLYTLLINEIYYGKDSNNNQIDEKEKQNYLFCNNKIINIGGCILKEGYNETDEIFFNNDDKCNKVKFYTNPQILMVIYNKIQISINHDYTNQKLLINNINCNDLFIECIMNTTQIKNIIKLSKYYLYNVITQNNKNENKDEINNNSNEFDLFNFKIKTLDVNISFNYCYFIFLNDEQNTSKFWMFYQNYFDKYYTMNIEQKKNSDISKKINTNNILNLIQKHFCYFGKEYYLIYINQPKFIIKNNSNGLALTTSSFISRLIQPNKVSEKINVIIIDNKSNNNEEYIDNEQLFNNLFLPYYKQVIQYGYYTHNIFIISNLDIYNKEILFNEMDVEINSLVAYNIMNYYKIIFSIGNEKTKNNNINEEKPDQNFEYNYNIKGKRINLNLMINKKWIDYIKDKKLNNCFDSHFYPEKILISIENTKFNVSENYQKLFLNFVYSKTYVFFIMKNIIYPLLYIINIKNKISNSGKQIDNSIIISKIHNNNYNVDSNYKYIINFDKIFTFINPILLTYYIIQYMKIFMFSFDIFKHNKNKIKSKKNINDIEENLNIDFISAQFEFENNKYNNYFFKLFTQLIKNIEINAEEINFVFFCHLSINNAKFDLNNLYEKNEYLFKLILSPIIILKLKECSCRNNKIKMNNVLLIAKIKTENFNREDLIYKEIIGNIDINSENCEFIIYKSKTQNNILQGEIKIEEKKNNVKVELNIDDIVFCPIMNKFNDIVVNIEKSINKYQKMNSYLFNSYPFINEKTDLIDYEKIVKKNYFYKSGNQSNDIKYKLKIKCTKLFLDLYSTNKNKMFYDKNLFENIIEKNKMRLLLEIGQISIEYTHNQKISLSLQKINSAFLKDLRISNTSCSLLIDEYSLINYSIVNTSNENSSNSLFFLKITEDENMKNKRPINKETKFGSIIANSGFVPILECENGISININLNTNDRIINNTSINTNNVIIINDLNFKFCKDSLKDIIYFIKKIPNDIQTLLNLKSAFKDDVEKIIIEKDAQSISNLKAHLIKKDTNSDSSSIEFHSVKIEQGDYKNNNMYNRLLNVNNEYNNNQGISESKYKNEENNIINKNIIFEENYKYKNKKKNYKIDLQINNINIYLYDGEDFNFQGSHTLVVFYNSTFTAENKSNQENIIKHNERNINNNIIISINELKCKYSKKVDDIEMNISLKSLIIEDNIEKSIYKKLLSHFDFENDNNILFNSKIKISKEVNGNGINDINAKIDITPIAIYLDKETLDFIFIFFNVLKRLINNENEEYNDEDTLNTNESNNKLNNRIIQNNDDIININNEDNNSSNNELMGDQEISSINQLQNDNIFKSYLNPDKLFINTLVINPFFISFNYNPGKDESSEEIIEPKLKTNSYNLKNLKYFEFLKNISLNECVLNFKKYDNSEDNKQIKIKYIFKELFEYYYKDIIDYKSFNNYVKALPVVNKVCSIFEGFYNIWDKTIDHEKNNNTLEEGFVLGTQDLVVNTTCSLLSMGETITGYFNRMFNLNENENNNKGIIKIMKKKINEKLYKKEEYYFK